jgi:hypothetical protein
LFLTKVSYAFIGPLFALGLLVDRIAREQGSWRTAFYAEAREHVVPCGLMLGFWGMLNWVKFGHPLLTGYHVWKPEMHGFTGNLRSALYPLIFSVQWGFVMCFPMLALALPSMGHWIRRQPVRFGTIVGIGAAYVILIGMLPVWTGAWCYGPRYWLFVLPFVSLPAIGALQWMQRRTPAAMLAAAATVAVLGSSIWLQMQVNRFPFMAYYYAMVPLDDAKASSKGEFFTENSYGWIEYSMWRNRYRLDRLPWWRDYKAHSSTEWTGRYEQEVRNIFGSSNLFFFPRCNE